VASRKLRYVFESDQQIRFFFEKANKIYDSKSNTIVKDRIKVLSVNNKPNVTSAFTFDQDWEIDKEYIGLDGYVDNKKIELAFSDTDSDGVVDDPDVFENIVDTSTTAIQEKYVILERYDVIPGQQDYRYISNSNETVLMVANELSVGNLNLYVDGQYFYFEDKAVVKKLDKIQGRFVTSLDYKVYPGRAGLKFQYVHSADYETRIDPGQTNIVDLYVLTREYDVEFRKWLSNSIDDEPLPSSSDQLFISLAPSLNAIKSVSDEIIYHPVKYKVLFGAKASLDVRASFKIIKNTEQPISDNDIKSRVVTAINEFFALENWDFGDSFYFSELATYVMNRTAPYLVNFVIVPRQSNLSFGSLFEIKADSDQIFINGATTDDIEVVEGITSSVIASGGSITATSNVTAQQSVTSRTGSY
jgi:hypothetical protein